MSDPRFNHIRVMPRTLSPCIPENLEEFRERMLRWDWHYAMSDDHQVWVAGERANAALRAFLHSPKCTPAHRAIYDEASKKARP